MMKWPFWKWISLGLALVVLGWATNAPAQSAAEAKRTLKAQKIFYKEPGMIEIELQAMRGGILMMTGYAPTEEHKAKADELAKGLRGIKDPRNRIKVREPDVAAPSDDVLREKIASKIQEDDDLARADAKGKLEVQVEGGRVTVKGKVGDYVVAQALVNEIRYIPGVKLLDFTDLKY